MAILSEVSSDEETPVVRFDRPPAVVMTGKDFLASTQDPKQPPLQLSDRAEAIIQDISSLAILCLMFFAMDLAIHQQYSLDYDFKIGASHLVNYAPGAAFIAYMINHHGKKPWMRAQMFLGSCMAGSYLFYLVNKESYLVVVRSAPALASIWVFLVVMMSLPDTIASLAVVAGFAKYKGLSVYGV